MPVELWTGRSGAHVWRTADPLRLPGFRSRGVANSCAPSEGPRTVSGIVHGDEKERSGERACWMKRF